MAMPTESASPWPSGPVVTSTPGVWRRSGWPGVREPHWRKPFRSSSSRPNPHRKSSVYWRIEAWPFGEDEPVAVGPGRVGGVVAHDAAEQHVTERRERHGRALVAGRGGQRRVHGHPADEVDGLLIELGREGGIAGRVPVARERQPTRMGGSALRGRAAEATPGDRPAPVRRTRAGASGAGSLACVRPGRARSAVTPGASGSAGAPQRPPEALPSEASRSQPKRGGGWRRRSAT